MTVKELTMQDAVKSIAPTISAAIQQWINSQNPAEITSKIHKMLDSSRDDVAAKLLGMNKGSFGRGWELDHCNGRAGESAMGDYLRKTQAESIKSWLDSINLQDVKPFSEAELAELRTEYRQRTISQVRQLVRQQADDDAAKLVKELSNTDFVEGILKTQKLIGAEFTPPTE